MAYGFVQGQTGASFGSATTFAITLAAPVTSGNSVLGAVYFTTVTGTVTSVTDDKGNTYNLSTTLSTASVLQVAFWLGNITNAPSTITITVSASSGNWVMMADEFSGTLTTSNNSDGNIGQVQAAPGTTTDAITSGNITTTANGDLIWGVTFDTGGTTLSTTGTGFTATGTSYNGAISAVLSEYLTQSSSGVTSATFSQGAADPASTFVIALKAVGGAADILQSQIWM